MEGGEGERKKFIMYNKTKGVMGNNIDIKIRIRRDLYEKCRFKNVNADGEKADLKICYRLIARLFFMSVNAMIVGDLYFGFCVDKWLPVGNLSENIF